MNPKLLAMPIAATALALPGCIVSIDGDGSSSSSRFAEVGSPEFNSLVSHNRELRLGTPKAEALQGFPAENTTLIAARRATALDGSATDFELYRVYAKDKHVKTSFRRYYLFENGLLAIVSDDRDEADRIMGLDG